MELHIFAGAHRTAQGHLRAQLEHNRDLLESQGVLIPDMDKAEAAMLAAIKAVRKGNMTELTAPALMSELTGDKPCKRVLVIRPSMSGSPLRPTKNGIYYPRGSATIAQVLRLLENVDVRLFFALRNPASFLPSCYNVAVVNNPDVSFAQFAQQSNPYDLRWSEYLHRVQGKDGDVPLITWSFEDYPYIWRSVAQAFSGIANKEDLLEAPVPLDPGVSLKGAMLLRAYLLEHPPESPEQTARIVEKFEQRFPPFERETVEDMWPEEMVTQLTDSYDDDNYYIDRMENVIPIRKPVFD